LRRFTTNEPRSPQVKLRELQTEVSLQQEKALQLTDTFQQMVTTAQQTYILNRFC
jgi:hypothetical protein